MFSAARGAESQELRPSPSRHSVDAVRDFVPRALVAGRCLALMSVNLLRRLHAAPADITGLLLWRANALVVVLTLVRRRAQPSTDRSIAGGRRRRCLVAGPPLVRAADGRRARAGHDDGADLGCRYRCVVIAGKVALGRSFRHRTRQPRHRRPRAHGFVRHPIHSGYIVTQHRVRDRPSEPVELRSFS